MTFKEFDQLKIGDEVGYRAFSKFDKEHDRKPIGTIVYINRNFREAAVLNELGHLEVWNVRFMSK